jgi:hypothetical protein
MESVWILGVLLVGAFMAWSMMRNRKAMAQFKEDYKDFTAGALAERLALTLERGDASTNLVFTGKGGWENQAFDIMIRGTAYGAPVDLVYYRKVSTHAKALGTETRFEYDCRITAYMQADVGRFEISIAKPSGFNQVQPYFEGGLARRSFGDAKLDAVLRIEADDPGIPMRLVPFLGALLPLNYVHVIGKAGQVSFVMTHGDCGTGMEMIGAGYGFHAAPQLVHMLASIACTLDGRPAPGAFVST